MHYRNTCKCTIILYMLLLPMEGDNINNICFFFHFDVDKIFIPLFQYKLYCGLYYGRVSWTLGGLKRECPQANIQRHYVSCLIFSWQGKGVNNCMVNKI